LQIEINRAIYMDERSYRRRPALARLSEEMTGLIMKLGEAARDSLAQTC
jgi:N-formylglutamate amidohydrolase